MLRSTSTAVAIAVVAAIAACGKEPRQTGSESSPGASVDSIVRLGPYAGILPCADCSGIRTELTLFAAHPSGAPLVYHLRETYLGTTAGDRTLTSAGRWTVSHGLPSDPGATVYQIAVDKPDEQRSFRSIGTDSLRLLDRTQAEIVSAVPHTLVRGPAAAPPLLVTATRTTPVALRVGQELLVRLPANRATGYTWSLADTAGAMSPQSTLYVQDVATGLALGVGGNEYWRLRAAQPGSQTLHFEYRRPWEPGAAPAAAAAIQVGVRP